MVICQQMELQCNKYCDVLSQSFRQSGSTRKNAFTTIHTHCIYLCWCLFGTKGGWINGQNHANPICGYFLDFTAHATPVWRFRAFPVTKYNTVGWNDKMSHSAEISRACRQDCAFMHKSCALNMNHQVTQRCLNSSWPYFKFLTVTFERDFRQPTVTA